MRTKKMDELKNNITEYKYEILKSNKIIKDRSVYKEINME